MRYVSNIFITSCKALSNIYGAHNALGLQKLCSIVSNCTENKFAKRVGFKWAYKDLTLLVRMEITAVTN